MSSLQLIDKLVDHLDQSLMSSNTSKQNSNTSLPENHRKLYIPEWTELRDVVSKGLQQNYKNVQVEVVTCPDLTKKWGVSEPGICGNTRLADVGGVPYLFHTSYQKQSYNIPDIMTTCGQCKPCLVFGAGAGSYTVIDKNSELVINTSAPNGVNNCHYAKMVNNDENENKDNSYNNIPFADVYSGNSIGCLGNLFLSDGKIGKVLYVKASIRTGSDNLISCIRKSLSNLKNIDNDGGINQVGLGGIIKVNKGKIKSHIMENYFNKITDFSNSKIVDDWLQFFEVGPNLLMFGTLITGDPTKKKELNLRLDHTHFYSLDKNNKTDCGHYHIDTTPDIIEYEGYFNIAQYIYRIDNAFEKLTKRGEKYWS